MVNMEPKALVKDPLMRMLSGAVFRGFTTGRVGPKDNALELKRLKVLCTKGGVDPADLTSANRYGKMIALKFSSSSQAQTFERDFKTINIGGRFSHFWSEAPKNTNDIRIQILPYVIGGPSRKDSAHTRTGLSSLGDE